VEQLQHEHGPFDKFASMIQLMLFFSILFTRPSFFVFLEPICESGKSRAPTDSERKRERSLSQIHKASRVDQRQEFLCSECRIQTFQDELLDVVVNEELHPKMCGLGRFFRGVDEDLVLITLRSNAAAIFHLHDPSTCVDLAGQDMDLFVGRASK